MQLTFHTWVLVSSTTRMSSWSYWGSSVLFNGTLTLDVEGDGRTGAHSLSIPRFSVYPGIQIADLPITRTLHQPID